MRRRRILVIDDEVDLCEIMKITLETTDSAYLVSTANNGKAGLKEAKKFNPHLIVLDINMPVMDGIETLKRLKADSRTAQIPVLILSARDDEDIQLATAQLFHERYITKPVDTDELLNNIESILKRTGAY